MVHVMYNCPEPKVSRYFQWKRYVDFPVALLLAILALPIIGITWALVRLTSRGPGFFRQVRLGLDGKPFTIYKLRSMRIDAETATGAIWTARSDRRVTFLGKFLRKTHLDELPQLYNVLRGDMDLVGPRPERPEFVTELEKRIEGYTYRLYVRPGVTGLAQLNQAPDVDLNDVRRKLVFDFDYIEHCTLGLDIRILVCTALKPVRLYQSQLLKFLGLYREAQQSSWAKALLPASCALSGKADLLSTILMKRTIV